MEVLTLILAAYCLTLALTQSEGAWGIMEKVRQNKHVANFGVFDCFLCTSFWVSLALVAAFNAWSAFFIVWGASVVLDKLIMALVVK